MWRVFFGRRLERQYLRRRVKALEDQLLVQAVRDDEAEERSSELLHDLSECQEALEELRDCVFFYLGRVGKRGAAKARQELREVSGYNDAKALIERLEAT